MALSVQWLDYVQCNWQIVFLLGYEAAGANTTTQHPHLVSRLRGENMWVLYPLSTYIYLRVSLTRRKNKSEDWGTEKKNRIALSNIQNLWIGEYFSSFKWVKSYRYSRYYFVECIRTTLHLPFTFPSCCVQNPFKYREYSWWCPTTGRWCSEHQEGDEKKRFKNHCFTNPRTLLANCQHLIHF